MFKIREEQFSTFQIESRRQFALRVADFLRENIEEAKGEERVSLAIEIEPLLDRAHTYGFSTEREHVNFVISAAHLGAEFDTELPEVTNILHDDKLSSKQKSDKLKLFTVLTLKQIDKP